jgi:hypothetical protein
VVRVRGSRCPKIINFYAWWRGWEKKPIFKVYIVATNTIFCVKLD